MIPFNIAALLGRNVKVPAVDYSGCDALLWREGSNYYAMEIADHTIFRIRDGQLARFITEFPRHQTLCIMNDETGQPVRISPLGN